MTKINLRHNKQSITLLLLVIGLSCFTSFGQPNNKLLELEEYHNNLLSEIDIIKLDSLLHSPWIKEDPSFEVSINSFILKGMIERRRGNKAQSLEFMLSAVEKLDTSSLFSLKALAFHRTASLYHSMGELKLAAKYFEEAISISKHHDTTKYPVYLGDYAITLAESGQIDSATIFWNEIIDLYAGKEIKPENYYNTLNNLAIIDEWNGEYQLARNRYYQIEKFYKKENNLQGITLCYINLGGNFADIEVYDSAKYYFHLAKTLADSTHILEHSLKTTINLSRLYEATNEFREALYWEKIRSTINDSIKSSELLVQVGVVEEKFQNKIAEDRKQRKLEEEKLKADRLANIQFFGIFLGIVFFFLMVFMAAKLSLPEWLANGIVFFAFVLLFEFVLVVLDPFIDSVSNGKPVIKLGCNVLLALFIIPLHSLFEKRLRRFLTS